MKKFALSASLCLLGLSFLAYLSLRGSLPKLDGIVLVEGLEALVLIERDTLGVATIRGGNRIDVARATGFLHAQERFFQMDLLRRSAAGELAELFGVRAVPVDKTRRLHRLRAVAHRVITNASAGESALLEAYAQGVNAGLDALSVRPFEYLVLRTRPQAWQSEDTILVLYAMFFQLNDHSASRDSNYALLHDALPAPLLEFLDTQGTEWDAPLIGDPYAVPPVPGPEVCDLRKSLTRASPLAPMPVFDERPVAGSNGWAVAGTKSATGRAIIANDMHLNLRVPNIWYRVRLIVENEASPDEDVDITGVSLPGAPVVVAGSNGAIAWGFTNSRADLTDLVLLDLEPGNADAYRTPSGYQSFEYHAEVIEVRGADPVSFEIRSTIWGPVVGADHRGRLRALHWLAGEPDAANLGLFAFERFDDVRTAVRSAPAIGIPPQNLIVADAQGNIAWTIVGRIPVRAGYDPRLPAAWSDPSTGWRGWLAPEHYPAVVNPDSGFVWTANARVVDGLPLERLGTGGYTLGARARQIRDGLLALNGATIDDMLDIQLDDRALLHQRWRELLLGLLSSDPATGNPLREDLRGELERWDGRASVESVGYRLVRAFRIEVRDELFAHIFRACGDFEKTTTHRRLNQFEGPLWRLVAERPAHFLPDDYGSWTEFLLAKADAAIAACGHERLALCTWGEANVVTITHPLSQALPFLAGLLDIHDGPLPGGTYTPRVQRGAHGASERFAVSPGDEANGYFHMPGGQSGHPLSPFYRAGHDAWVNGDRLPFLPGATHFSLTLIGK
ncbi:MAG: penicillin acylase family protein [Proteobacteria bacterium]|nr:penicillin acylase family protein [Pseudomonadota bacterium]